MTDRSTRLSEEARRGLPLLNPKEVAEREAENGLLQFDLMNSMIASSIESRSIQLTPEAIKALQNVAVDGLEPDAGVFRTAPVYIDGTSHVPPPAEEVPRLVVEMCEYINTAPAQDGEDEIDRALRLSAYAMWRLNWIHPFLNGNGRTSRAVSYYVLCSSLGYELGGTTTIPDLIASKKPPYYKALDAADAAWKAGKLDVTAMQDLLAILLMRQVVGDSPPPEAQAENPA